MKKTGDAPRLQNGYAPRTAGAYAIAPVPALDPAHAPAQAPAQAGAPSPIPGRAGALRRCFATFLLLVLSVFAAPLGADAASNADRLNGVWVVDIDATIDILMQNGEIAAADVERTREVLATVRITYDLPNSTFTGEMGGGPPTMMRIEKVEEERDGTIRITSAGESDLFRFRPDGMLLVVKHNLVLKRPD